MLWTSLFENLMARFCIICFFFASITAPAQRIMRGLEVSSVISYTNKDTSYSFHVTNEKVTNFKSSSYYWYGQGDLRSTQGNYSGKLLHGAFEKFNRNHALIEKGKFENGLKEGTWTRWYPDGKFQSNYRWRNGARHGRFEEYHLGGGISRAGSYSRDKLSGSVKVYDKNGSMTEKLRYRQGKLINDKVKKKENDKS